MAWTRIDVAAAAGNYPVLVGADVLSSLGRELDAAGLASQRVFVSSPRVWALQGKRLRGVTKGAKPVLVADGERSKTLRTVEHVHDALIRAKADRSVVIVAVGGGVIGDLVGFAAAS